MSEEPVALRPDAGGGGVARVEREIKLDVDDRFRLPDLTAVLAVAAVTSPPQRLEAVYYDTADLGLARWGATLRHRTGEGPARWTLKLPEPGRGPGLWRREVEAPGDGEPPASLVRLVAALTLGRDLGPVATLSTVRRRHVVLSASAGAPLCEIAEDVVQVRAPGWSGGGFREVEIELAEGAPAEVLESVAGALIAAGARRGEASPKLLRALGAGGAKRWPAADRAGRATVGWAVAAALRASTERLLVHDPLVRLGEGPEAVHQARVATRRLRSDLATFAGMLDRAWAEGLRSELKQAAGLLGALRDADVLLARLTAAAAGLDTADWGPAERLLGRLEGEREEHRRALLGYLGGAPYLKTIEKLLEGASHPPVTCPGEPARDALPPALAARWSRLRREVRSLPVDPSDVGLHRVRIAAKRCRYAAEAVAPAFGKPVRRLAAALASLQEDLGSLQDSALCAAWLREAAAQVPGDQAFVAGRLVSGEDLFRNDARAHFPLSWKRTLRAAEKVPLR